MFCLSSSQHLKPHVPLLPHPLMPVLSREEALARYEARCTGPLRDILDRPLEAGQFVHPTSGGREDKISDWPIWQVQQSTTVKLKLVAYGGTKSLPLTRERSFNIVVFTPSLFLDLRDYPEEWGWWRASGWLMWAEDGTDGRVHLHTSFDKGNGGRIWGAAATLKEIATADLARRFLSSALYYHLHPRKSRKAYESTGQVCTEAELTAFSRVQRRKALAGIKP